MLKTLLILFSVVALCLGASKPSNSGLSSTFDTTNLINFLKSKTPSTIQEAFYVSEALRELGQTSSKDLCTLATTALSKPVLENTQSFYQAATVAKSLSCSAKLTTTQVDDLKSLLAEGDVPNIFYAVFTSLALAEKSISEDDLTAVIERIGDLTESDGTVRTSSSDKDGTLYNAGLALQIYASLAKAYTLSEQDKEHVEDLAGKVDGILDLANEGENTLSFSSEGYSTLATTANLVSGFQAISAKFPVDIAPQQLTFIGEYFLSHSTAASVEDAYFLAKGLQAVASSKQAPIALIIERSSISATAKEEGKIKISVADILGKPVNAKVLLVNSFAVGKPDLPLLSNHPIDGALNFLIAKPEQGFYTLEFRAVPEDTKKYSTIDSTTRRVKVTGSIAVSDFELVVSDSREGREGSTYKAEYPKTIEENIQVQKKQFIHVQFKVRNAGGTTAKPLLAQQAFVRFVHKDSGHEAVFVASPNEQKVYSVVINVEDTERSVFNYQSGVYSVEVLVGDAFVQNPIGWKVAKSVSLQITSQPASPDPLAPKPVITHKPRKPDDRANPFISTVFTFATAAPIIVLLLGFASLGANLRKIPTGTEFFSAIGFVGFIGAILALIVIYWLRLNLVQTLTYLGVLAIPTIFFGQRTLSSLAKKE